MMITPAYSNLKEFIENGKDIVLTYHNFSFLELFKDIKFPIYNVLHDYIDDLLAECITVKLSEDEFTKYKYKPRLLSANVYGTTEYFYLILLLNNMASEKEFNKKEIKLLQKNKFQTTIQRIYLAEKANIAKYNNTLLYKYQISE